MQKLSSTLFVAIFLFAPIAVFAEDFFVGEVVEVISESERFSPAIQGSITTQELRVKLESGEFIFVENDRFLSQEGDKLFIRSLETSGETLYSVQEPDRRAQLLWAVGLFALVSIVVGRFIGVRALVSLGVSFAVIIYLLLPALSSGVSPVAVSIGFSAFILAVAMAITHGVNKTTLAAFTASIITIAIAVALGQFFVSFAHLTGFADDTATILNLTTGGTLNMEGILLGALIIGILGIIDDVTVTQVSTVGALHDANNKLSHKDIYRRAMKVGRDHFGAVVNTLFLAYAGASLPLLLLFVLSPASPFILVNSEIIAIEIVRASVGGIALALALPISTYMGIVSLRFPGKHPAHVGHGH